MGTDAWITLPEMARLRDVADVIGKLCGCTSTLEPRRGHFHVDVKGVKTKPTDTIPECAHIYIENDKGYKDSLFWHFELEESGRGLSRGSNARGIALFRRLADFFGGKVDYNDCDNRKVNYRRNSPKWIHASDGKPWDTLQRAIHNVKPLTLKEVKACQKWAAQSWDEAWIQDMVKHGAIQE